ncbi:MAG: DUF1080 domain-containing protein [Planctomycetaceae bacterium]|nr:DUF1080 domain-containing protein [Planctomycetaceae bacterium]
MYRLLPAVALFALVVNSQAPLVRAEEKKGVSLFNGKDLDGWKTKDEVKSKWKVCSVQLDPKNDKVFAEMTATPGTSAFLTNLTTRGGTDLFTTEKFGDVTVELEFMYPKGSNSGVYLMGEYEVQILDSFGKEKVGPGDLGGLYKAAAPTTNASKKPGEWQKFVIEFQAPKFEGDKKTVNAKFVKVTLNDTVIHENIEMKTQTPGGLTGKEAATGPLMFQGDHGPVAFRNIKITPKK